MFRRDPLVALLREVGTLLGREPEATWRALAREALAHGGVIGVARGEVARVFAVGEVPTGGVFELASVTKPFTAALAQALVGRGSLAWDTPLRSLGGPLRGLPRHFTPLSLATHTAGVPTHPARANLTGITHFHDPYGSMSAQAVLNSARRWARPTQPPRFLYSNLGVGVLALALAHAAGQMLSAAGYAEALRDHVLNPLDLPSMTLTPHPATLVTPRGLLGGDQATGFGPLTGAGGLYGNAADLLRFGQAHVSGQAGRHWQQRLNPPGLVPPQIGVAPGWFYADAPDGPVLWHDGVARGTRSAIAFQPARGRVVVVLARGGLPVLGNRSGVPLLLLRLLGALARR